LPFAGESTGVIYDGIMNRTPLSVLRLDPNLPPKLADNISRALEKDRDLRLLAPPQLSGSEWNATPQHAQFGYLDARCQVLSHFFHFLPGDRIIPY